MLLALSGVVLASQLVVAVADQVPKIDFMPACRRAAATGTGATPENCVGDEQRARDQLTKEWPQFSNKEKADCMEEIHGFEPSYVELLTCIEAATSAKQVPHE